MAVFKIYRQSFHSKYGQNYIFECYSATNAMYNSGDETQYIDLPLTTIQLNSIIATERETKARLGFPSNSIASFTINLDFNLYTDENYKEFASIMYKPTILINKDNNTVGFNTYWGLFRTWRIGNIWTIYTVDNANGDNKKAIFCGVQTSDSNNKKSNTGRTIEIDAEHVTWYALKSIDFKATFAYTVWSAYQGHYDNNDNPEDNSMFRFPIGYLSICNNNIAGVNGCGSMLGGNNSLLGIVDSVLPNATVSDYKQDKNVIGHGYATQDTMWWLRFDVFIDECNSTLNKYIKCLLRGYNTKTKFLPNMLATFYKQTYDNTGSLGDVVSYNDLYFCILKTATSRLNEFGGIDMNDPAKREYNLQTLLSCSDLYNKLSYESLFDWLHDFCISNCCYANYSVIDINGGTLYPISTEIDCRLLLDNNITVRDIDIDTVNTNNTNQVISSNCESDNTDINSKTHMVYNVSQGGSNFNANNTFHNQPTRNTVLDDDNGYKHRGKLYSVWAGGIDPAGTDYINYQQGGFALSEFDTPSNRFDVFDVNKYGAEMALQLFYIERKSANNPNLPPLAFDIPVAVHSYSEYKNTNGRFAYNFNNYHYIDIEFWDEKGNLKDPEGANQDERNRWRHCIANAYEQLQDNICIHNLNGYAISNSLTAAVINNTIYDFIVATVILDIMQLPIVASGHGYSQPNNPILDYLASNTVFSFPPNDICSPDSISEYDLWYAIESKFDVKTGLLELTLINKTFKNGQ